MTENVPLAIPAEFDAFCRAAALTPHAVLTAFMHDLAETGASNGSDERRAALQWFDRVIWPNPADDFEDES